jgi:peptidyl-prolyl cis-trans isomerase D
MLDFFRTHQRLMQFLLLLIIFPSFAFFGLQSYTSMSDREAVVAEVAGQKIYSKRMGRCSGTPAGSFQADVWGPV